MFEAKPPRRLKLTRRDGMALGIVVLVVSWAYQAPLLREYFILDELNFATVRGEFHWLVPLFRGKALMQLSGRPLSGMFIGATAGFLDWSPGALVWVRGLSWAASIAVA